MAVWIIFIHPPREDFAETLTAEEEGVRSRHYERYERMLEEGTLILAGPTLGPTNTGGFIFEEPDEASARQIMANDPRFIEVVMPDASCDRFECLS